MNWVYAGSFVLVLFVLIGLGWTGAAEVLIDTVIDILLDD